MVIMDKDLEQLMKCQRDFFTTGKTREYAFRMQALSRLFRALKEYERELERALKKDLNKCTYESYMSEIGLTLSELSYVKKHLKSWMRSKREAVTVSQFPAKCLVMPEPYGVVLVMAPWNYPVLLCLEPLIDAVAAGNCVVLKPSAYAPAVSEVLKKMLGSIYPQKYVAVVEGGRKANSELLEQRFDYIFFTGSVSVGRLVMEKAAQNLTPVTLELGGKSPCIVDETADIKLAARRIAFGKLINAGQTCVAPDYVVVQKKVEKQLIDCLGEEMRKMLGDALKNPAYPKIINQKHYDRILSLIEGETVQYGGAARPDTLQIAPSVLTGVTLASPVMKEEIFGPVLPVLTYETEEELEKIITSFGKPLALYLFSRRKERIRWVLRTFSFGGGCVNDTLIHLASPHMPFGGVGNSGMGSYHGKAGFTAFSHNKSIVCKKGSVDIPLRYQPYNGRNWKILRIMLK